ncbi:MAG: acetylornithine deacetylase [Gemmatimonadales bacterium]
MPGLLSDTELLRRLIAFDTTSANSNRPLVEFLCDYLEGRGAVLELLPSPEGDKANLLVTLGPSAGPDRAGLVLSGHTDVVPAREQGWESDPFTLVERDGRFIARGTCDMKGFLALAVNRLAGLNARDLRAPLVLLFTYDEEVGTLGARDFVAATPAVNALPAQAVIGEPTSLRPVRSHKGHLKLRLEFAGRTAHSGFPALGRNAIEPAGRAVAALGQLRAQLERERPPSGGLFPDVPFVALNLARIEGGSAINVIPDRCTLDLGLRLLPDSAAPVLTARVLEAVTRVVPAEAFRLASLGESPAMVLDPSAPLFQALCRETGCADGPGLAFATDAGWLHQLPMDCVILGPGDIAVAHRPNEWLPVAEFHRAGEILDRMIARFCG